MCCSIHGCGGPDEVDMCKSAYQVVTEVRVVKRWMKDQTLTKVFLYLDGILVDRDGLTWDKGALVSGLLEGHKDVHLEKQTERERPRLVNSRGNHVAYVINSDLGPISAP